MKRLLPSLREKKRYIVFEANISDKKIIFNEIDNVLNKFLGILGMSKVNPFIMKDKFKNNRGIIRINHAYKDEVITSLSLIKKFKISVIGVSGILNKAEERYMRWEKNATNATSINGIR